MKCIMKLIFLLIFLEGSFGAPPSYPIGDIRNCPTEQIVNPGSPLLRMDALPGLGFDNLRNIELGQVYYRNYTSCQVSNDGYYLLPDSINLIPVLNSEVDFYAETFEHYDQYTSSSSSSINVEASVSYGCAHASGKFSTEHQDTKKKMASTKSSSVRIGLRHHLYSVHVNPDGQLHPSFKSRLMDLAAHIQNNDTQMAHYLSDLIIRDYGTHVVTSVEAGGALYQTSFISKNYSSNSDQSAHSIGISASVRAHFMVTFSVKTNLDFSDQTGTSDTTGTTTHHIRTSTHGGPPFKMGSFNYTEWQNGLQDNLVAIDRRGQPLCFAMTTSNLPELPDILLMKTSDYIYQAIVRYYKINTIKGCMEMGSPNFNFHANLNDQSCKKERSDYNFGGIYQTCDDHYNNEICNDFGARQTNPLTSDYSCPQGYESILLHTGTLSKMVQITYYQQKSKCSWFHCKMQTVSNQQSEMRYSTYKAYWCYAPPGQEADLQDNSGYMFGGAYTSKTPNPVTHTSGCPPFFNALHFGEDIKVCVSNDEQAKDNALPFGGFHSCKSGNPLAITKEMYGNLTLKNAELEDGSSFPKECSQHYNQFLIATDEGCVVNYCTQIKDIIMYTPKPPIVPPYKMKPPMTVNKTESLIIFGPYGNIWFKGDDGNWLEYKSDNSVTGYNYLQSFITNEQDISTPLPVTEPPTNATPSTTASSDDGSTHYTGSDVAGIVLGLVFATALCIGFILVVGVGINKYRKKRKARKETLLYLDKSVPEPGENETAVLIQKIQD